MGFTIAARKAPSAAKPQPQRWGIRPACVCGIRIEPEDGWRRTLVPCRVGEPGSIGTATDLITPPTVPPCRGEARYRHPLCLRFDIDGRCVDVGLEDSIRRFTPVELCVSGTAR